MQINILLGVHLVYGTRSNVISYTFVNDLSKTTRTLNNCLRKDCVEMCTVTYCFLRETSSLPVAEAEGQTWQQYWGKPQHKQVNKTEVRIVLFVTGKVIADNGVNWLFPSQKRKRCLHASNLRKNSTLEPNYWMYKRSYLFSFKGWIYDTVYQLAKLCDNSVYICFFFLFSQL